MINGSRQNRCTINGNRLFNPGTNSWDLFGRTSAPPKVEFFSWIAIQERISTRSVLSSRNIILEGQSVSFPLCSLHLETPDHLLLPSQFSWKTWSLILDWWPVTWVCPKTVSDLARWWFDTRFRNLEKNVWEASFYATLWSLWLVRKTVCLTTLLRVLKWWGNW